MHIVFLFGHKLTIGGHFRTAQAWICEMTRAGQKVEVITWRGPHEGVKPFLDVGASWRPLEDFGARPGGSALGPRNVSAAIRLSRYLRREGVDLLHLQDAVWLSAGALAAALAGRPMVLVHAGGDYVNQQPPPRCGLVVLSRELEQGYRGDGVEAACIRARLNRAIFHPGPRDPGVERKFALPSAGFRFLIAMRIGPFKKRWLDGVLQVARDVAFARETHIIMVGGGRLFEWMKGEVAALNAHSGAHARIHLLGPVHDPAEMAALYRSADVVMGHGRGIMEAMGCGRPVICLGEQGEAELVAPKRVETMADYNFSGRHFRGEPGAPTLETLLPQVEEREDLDELADFCLRYADRELDAARGAEALMGVYHRRRPIRFRDWPGWAVRRKLFYLRNVPPPGEPKRRDPAGEGSSPRETTTGQAAGE